MAEVTSDAAWPAGGGEMAGRVRLFDWAGTPLGPVEGWSERLRCVVELVLAGGFPMVMLWGPELVQIYNDGFAALMGGKHPAGLGQSARECWREAWHINEPIHARVLAGETVTLEDALYPIKRGGEAEDAWFTLSCSPLTNGDGGVAGALVTMFETTAEHRAASMLRESEGRQVFLLKLSDALRPLGGPVEVMATASEMLGRHLGVGRCGYGEADATGEFFIVERDWTDGDMASFSGKHRLVDFGPKFTAAYRAGRSVLINDALADARVEGAKATFEAAGGVRASLGVPLIKDGRFVAGLFAHQISPRGWSSEEEALVREVAERTWAAVERARAEAAARESEARLTAAFESVPVGTAVLDLTGSIVVANAEFRSFLPSGVIPSRDPERGHRWRAWDEDGRPLDRQNFPGARATRGERVVPGQEMLYTEGGGREIWTSVAAAPIRDEAGQVTGSVAVISNIDERKRALEALRESEERFRTIATAIEDVFYLTDVDSQALLYLSPSYERVWGRPAGEVMADLRRFGEAIHPDDVATMSAGFAAQARGEPVRQEYRIVRPDGEVRWILDRCFPVGDGSGTRRAAGVATDITERKALGTALADSERWMKTLLEGVSQLIWRAVGEGWWTWAGPQWEEYTGQTSEESEGVGWLEMLHPDDRIGVMRSWKGAKARGEFHAEYRVHHASESRYRWFQTRATPVRNEAGEVVEWLGTTTDIDDMHRLQERQHVLVAELQHRVRNILTVVRSVFGRTAEAANDPAEMADHFLGRLAALARTQVIVTQTAAGLVDLENLIRDELISVGVTDGPDVRIEGPDVGLTSKAAESMGLAIHELTTNALKYGALKVAGAKLNIIWDVKQGYRGGRTLNLTWTEQGVPAVPLKPARQGFGRELIEEALPYRLQAETELEFRGGGVRCSISLPLPDRSGEGAV